MTGTPEISVVIPCYNVAPYVEETVESVLNATRHFDGICECICVDDGSRDGTGAILDAFQPMAATQKNLVYKVIHQANAGTGMARNAGSAVATGEWLTFLDGDDLWCEDILSKMSESAHEHPQADIVNFTALRFGGDYGAFRRPSPDGRTCRVLDARDFIADELVADLGIFPTLFRRETFKDVSHEPLSLGQDRLYVARCLTKTNQVVRDSLCVVAYRQREGSSTHLVWSVRKILSQCDYGVGALRYLASSGKRIGCGGVRYLVRRWLSEVPNRILRLKDRDDRRKAWEHWIRTVKENDFRFLSPWQSRVRRLILACQRSVTGSLYVARLFRKLGVV